MKKKSQQNASPDSWYALEGKNQDVVLSTRASLVRNLANFPFPSILDENESERIQSIAFDAFTFLPDAQDFHTISVDKLDEMLPTSIFKDVESFSSCPAIMFSRIALSSTSFVIGPI